MNLTNLTEIAPGLSMSMKHASPLHGTCVVQGKGSGEQRNVLNHACALERTLQRHLALHSLLWRLSQPCGHIQLWWCNDINSWGITPWRQKTTNAPVGDVITPRPGETRWETKVCRRGETCSTERNNKTTSQESIYPEFIAIETVNHNWGFQP